MPRSGTRPTSDRVREAIFSTLEAWNLVDGAQVLDLYAGSGALGLEAASRGAASVTLVEKHPQSAQVAQRNARTVSGAFRGDAPEHSPRLEVVRQSVQTFLETALHDIADQRPTFDVVFIDPPYDLGEAELTACLTALLPLLADGAAVMIERSSRSPEPRLPPGLAPIKQKRYGETLLWWVEPA